MSKTIYEANIGGDGGKAGAYINEGSLEVKASYPLSKLVDPVKAAINKGIDSAENAIPGDVDKLVLEPIRAAIMVEIDKLLAGI